MECGIFAEATTSAVPNSAHHVIIGNNSIALKEAKNLLEAGGFTSTVCQSIHLSRLYFDC